jgi:tRNA (cmo5U34)-methyltransferase
VGQFHFDPGSYLELIQAEVPRFEELQEEVAAATIGPVVGAMLELGTGTGETARRVLTLHPGARLVGVDESEAMLGEARLGDVELLVQRMQDPLPEGPFDLVFSALAVHHLDPGEKADLFRRVRASLRPGGRFVLGDVVVPARSEDAVTPVTPGFDKPDPVPRLLEWLDRAGFTASVAWSWKDVAVLVGEASTPVPGTGATPRRTRP